MAHRAGKLAGSLCMARSLLTDYMLISSMAFLPVVSLGSQAQVAGMCRGWK